MLRYYNIRHNITALYTSTAQRVNCVLCRNSLKKAQISGLLFGLSQSLIFFGYAAIFTFGAWLIINRGLHFENMFK